MKKQKKETLCKRILTVFVALMLMIMMAPVEVFAETATDVTENGYTDSDGSISGTVKAETAEDNIASGTGWALSQDGVLTVESDDGMRDWRSNRNTYRPQVKQIVIQSGVTKVILQAFYNCDELISVEIPASVINIEQEAFYGCNRLASVTMLGATPPILGANAFALCKFTKGKYTPGIVVPTASVDDYQAAWIELIDYISDGSTYDSNILERGTDWELSVDGLLTIQSDAGLQNWIVWRDTFDQDFYIEIGRKVKKSLVKKVIIANGVTEIVDHAFTANTNMSEVQIPDTVIKIGKEAFRQCNSLTEIKLPSNLQELGDLAFANSKITKITIPEKVKVIPVECFYNNPLTSITIPAGITEIQLGAFNASTLTEVRVEGTLPAAIGEKIFRNTGFVQSSIKGIIVPHGYAEAYQAAWSDWAAYIQPDIHETTLVPAIAATCSEAGQMAYYICTLCNKWFEDEDGNNEITDKNSIVIAATGHAFSAEWTHDDTSHWHEATCGDTDEIKNKADHTFGDWHITKPATEQETGVKERSCNICGYTQIEVIPQIAASEQNIGKIETDKEQGENTPVIDFGTAKEELINAVLMPEEQHLVEGGEDIKITLVIDNIDASVSQADKQAVVEEADAFKVGEYLDISLYKLIGTDKTKISQTNGKIKVVLTIPDSLKNTDSKQTRSYAVVRVHNNVAELLKDIDTDEDTITIETDRFSIYAIVYKDTKVADNDKNSDAPANEKDNGAAIKPTSTSPNAGAATPTGGYLALILAAGLFGMLQHLDKRSKTAMKQEKGN